MLQRAASNAYSWWWASHIRTKQTKWLDQSLQDMEEKVHEVIKLIEEDGDSFARRAEMYYKKRPELINFVQESYRAFRSLADRYDLLSKELQNANHQLATVFPEQYQMEIEYDDDFTSPKPPRKFVPNANTSNLPNVPKAPIKKWKGLVSASKQLQKPKKEGNKTVQKSGLSKNEALEELDKVQKEILSLQTVKEFVKSSYQNGLQKYKGIENQISEKQQRLGNLQDEFGLNKSIEDNEARTLMAEAALKSCEETLAQLKEKQEKYHHEAKQEFKKIQDARQKLNSIKKEFLHDQTETRFSEESKSSIQIEPQNSIDEQLGDITNDIKEIIDGDSSGSLTVTQLAEKIDKLVNKVINLETSISSQTILIDRLRTEANDLNSQIHVLEKDKPNLTDNNNTQELKIKVQKMEEKLDGIQALNRDVETRNNNLQTHFAEARSSLDHLSEKLSNIKPDEDDETPLKVIIEQKKTESENRTQQNAKCNGQIDTTETNTIEEIKKEDPGTPVKSKTVKFDDEKSNQNQDDLKIVSETETEDEFDWKKMLLSGAGDIDKVLLKEYTTTLRNYKEAKKKLLEMEKKEKDQEFEVTIQIRELKSNLTKKEDEIQRLRQKLTLLQEKNGEDSEKNELRLPSFEKKEDEEDIKLIFLDQPKVTSPIEEKLRQEIESILDENLDFWLRFSSSYHQIEKFKTSIQDLQDEITKLNEKKKQEGNGMLDLKCDARPIYKHLKEIKTELAVWIDQSGLLRTELENRFSSLCNIQEKITNALKEGPDEDEIRFSSHQAAKLQGEIWNMKQENNKVREELQNGVDHISTLRIDIDKILEKLNEEFQLSGVKNTGNRPHVPLKSFIFGTKQKKQKNSIFAYMQMQTGKKNQGVRSGLQ